MDQAVKVDTAGMEFQATQGFAARLDKDGVHRRDKVSKLPLWAVELVVWGAGDDDRTDKILVTVAVENPPSISKRQFVEVTGLRAIPWVTDNGSRTVRIAYKAESVVPVKVAPDAVKKIAG